MKTLKMFKILGMRLIHSIYWPHATDININLGRFMSTISQFTILQRRIYIWAFWAAAQGPGDIKGPQPPLKTMDNIVN